MDLLLGRVPTGQREKVNGSPQEKPRVKSHGLPPKDRTQHLMTGSGVSRKLCVTPHMARCGPWALFLITAPSRLLEVANFTVKNDSRGQYLPRAGKRALGTARFSVGSSALCPVESELFPVGAP